MMMMVMVRDLTNGAVRTGLRRSGLRSSRAAQAAHQRGDRNLRGEHEQDDGSGKWTKAQHHFTIGRRV